MRATRALRFALVAALAIGCEKPAPPIVVPQSVHSITWREPDGRRTSRLSVGPAFTGVLDGARFANRAELEHSLDTLVVFGAPDQILTASGHAKLKLDLLVEAPANLPAVELARTMAQVVECGKRTPDRDLRAHLLLQGEHNVLKVPTRSDLMQFRGDPAKRHVIVLVALSQDAPTNRQATDSIWTLRVAPNSDHAKTPEQELRDQSLSQAAAQIASAGDAVTCLLVAQVSATFTLQQALDWLEPVLALQPDDLQWVARE